MTQPSGPNWSGLTAALRSAVVCLLLPLLVATCGEDGPSGPSGPPVVGRVEFISGPLLSGGFFGPNLPIDRVHVVIQRPPGGDLVKDTTRSFDPNQNQLRLDLPILLRAAAESLDVTLELLSGTTILFSGARRLEAVAGPPSSTPPPAIPLTYSGPGSQIAQLLIAPLDSTLGQGDSLIMRVSGLDVGQVPVAAFYVGWSSSDTSIARVNGAGVVRGRVPRGTVFIRARTPDTQLFPTGILESTTVTLVPDPASLIKVGGDNQAGAVGTALPQLLEVEVRAADGLPIAGIQVAFATTAAGASVDSAAATTDANGVARSGAVLGSVLGTQSFTASVPGTPSVTFTATATVPPSPTWTGAVSTDWNNPANWNLNAVPGAGDSVTVPSGTPNQPTLSSNIVVGALLNNGTITSGTFAMSLAGNLRGNGSIVGTSNLVIGAPGTLLDHGTIPNLVVQGTSVVLGRRTSVAGDITVMSNGGNLTLGGHTAIATGDMNIVLAGTLTMNNTVDTLQVPGDVFFNGNSTSGLISSGVMFIGGNFNQAAGSSSQSYAPTGNHIDVFNGTGTQNVTFQTPGAGQSNFETLVLANIAGGVTIGSDIFQAGPVGFAPGVPRIVHGSGQTVFVAELLASNVTLDNVLVVSNNVLITQFDSVNFINYSPTATPLTISHPGSAAPFVFNDLSFGVTPSSGGYISVTDIAADPNVLTINMVNPTPGASGGFVQTAGGAVVNWPFVPAGARTWTGAIDNDWFTPGNWSPAIVPGAVDDVIIPVTAVQPVINGTTALVNNLAIQNGATVISNGPDLVVSGNANVLGSFGGSGTLVMITHGTSVAGTVANLEIALATRFESILVGGTLTVTGGIDVGRGHFDVGANTVTTDDFGTNGEGMLKMVNPAGTLIVNGNATFGGEDPTGVLTAGTIHVRGHFNQLTVITQGSFVATGTNRVILDGTIGQVVSFQNPGASHFQDLEFANTSDTLYLGSDWSATGQLIKQVGGNVVVSGAAQLITASGAVISGIVFNNARVALLNGTVSQFDNVSWTGFPSFVTQLTVTRPSGTLNLSNHTFATTPTTGFYLRADDTNPSDGQPLTINMVGPTPATPGGFVQTAGGAVVNWPPAAGGVVTWTGATSTDWSTPGNWSTNAVPTFADSVVIPAGGNQPSLTATSFTGALHLANGTLTVNGQSLVVTGNFYSTGSGRLVMTNPADGISIAGDATFDGGNQLTFMSAGAILLSGDLIQLATNSPDSYHPSGTHTTFFVGATSQTVSFATPGLVPGTSHLQEVAWSGTAGLTFSSDVHAHGIFTAAGSTARTISSSGGAVLTTGGWISALGVTTFDNVQLVINQATPTILSVSNLAFTNQPVNVIQLQVGHPGSASAFGFTNLSFATVPTTGFYLSAIDLNGGDGLPFTIDMVNPSPATPGAFVQAVGSVINWPAAGGGGTSIWTGAVDNDWNNAGNWQGGNIPGSGDNVVLPAGMPNYPGLISSEVVANMDVAPGALVDFVDGFLEITGNLTGGGSMTNGGPELSGSGVLAMSDVGSLLVTGSIDLGSSLTITGDLTIDGAGAQFDVNGFVVDIASNLFLLNDGTMQMTNPTGAVDVGANVVFDGGSHNGLLTQGTLAVQGDFTQANTTSTSSFQGGTSFQVLFNGNSPQTISMADSITSFFGILTLGNPSGVIANSMIRVAADMNVGLSALVNATDLSILGTGFDVLGNLTAAAGSTLQLGRLYVANGVSISGTYSVTAIIFTGTGQSAPSFLPYQSFYSRGSVTLAGGNASMNTLVVEGGTLNLGGRTTVNGDVFVTGGTLKPNSQTIAIVGALNIQAAGTLTMQNSLDSVLVTGAGLFGGGSAVGLMTDGVLRVGGSFTQTSGTSTTSFIGTGPHKTILGAGAVRVVNFASPGSGVTGSHFGNLDVTSASGGLTIQSDLVVDGTLISAPTGTAPTITGFSTTRKLTAMSLGVTRASGTSLILDNTQIVVDEQGSIRGQVFDRAQFTGFPTTANSAVLMDMTLVGTTVTPRPVTFTAPSVQTSLGTGGLYARLASSNSQFVTVTISGSNDPTGGPSRSNPSFGSTVNGARIVWQ